MMVYGVTGQKYCTSNSDVFATSLYHHMYTTFNLLTLQLYHISQKYVYSRETTHHH